MKQVSRYCTRVEKSLMRKYPNALIDLNTISSVTIGQPDNLLFVPKYPPGQILHVPFKSSKLAKEELEEITRIFEKNEINVSYTKEEQDTAWANAYSYAIENST